MLLRSISHYMLNVGKVVIEFSKCGKSGHPPLNERTKINYFCSHISIVRQIHSFV